MEKYRLMESDTAELWCIGKEVYRVNKPVTMDTDGNPMGMRWECSYNAFLVWEKRDVFKGFRHVFKMN